MSKCWTVYVHTNKINGKKYIGITSRKPEVRWEKDGKGYREGKFRYAIQKYGWDNFDHEIIATGLTNDEANKMEIELIDKFNTRDDNYGYNIVIGGGSSIGFTHSEETKKICGLAQKGGKSVRAKKVICDDILFDCITDCANYYNVPKETMTGWLKGKRCAPQKFIDMNLRYYGTNISPLKPQTIPSDRTVLCNGMEFNTVKECAEFYEINPTRMTSWLNGNANMPKNFIDMKLSYSNKLHIHPKQQSEKRVKRKVICGGVVFESINECAKGYGVSSTTMGAWLLGRKRMPKKFIDLGLSYLNEKISYEEQFRELKTVICENNIFDTVKDCADHYNISPSVMRSWLKGTRNMPKKFYDMGLRFKDSTIQYKIQTGTKKKIACEGNIFNSLTSCANYYGVCLSTMSRWLNGLLPMPDKFIEIGLSYYKEDND